MSLNKLVDVLTQNNAPQLKRRTVFSGQWKREESSLLWGIVYARQIMYANSPNGRIDLIEIELVYEGTGSHDFYLVRPTLEQIRYKSDSNFFAVPEMRAGLFASPAEYRRFFELLFSYKLDGLISDALFMKAFDKIKELSNRLIPDTIAQAIDLHSTIGIKDKVIGEARAILYNDPFLNLIW
ncbi:MAG: hypothetical protein Q8R04_02545 [Nanoarchaeota archaeon]|nr:hypothetical protein [Nanoarchaeota archaeon]